MAGKINVDKDRLLAEIQETTAKFIQNTQI